MNEATPRWLMALGEELDAAAFTIKRTGRQDAPHIAARLRRIADILEQRI